MGNHHKIVLCGVQQLGIELIEYFIENNIKIDYIVTIEPDLAKIENVSGYVSYESVSMKYNIPIYYAKKYNLKAVNDIEFFQKNRFSVLVQGVWQRLFPLEVLETLSIGAIGIHGSSELLPKGRGRSPINWTLIEGKRRFIFHYFIIKPGIDDGDIFAIHTVDVNEWDDCKTLYYKNSIITKRVLVEQLPHLMDGTIKIWPQTGIPTYYPKRVEGDGLINWDKTVFEIYNFIRALTKPYPGAFSYINNNKVKIWRAQVFDTQILYPKAVIGEVVEVFGDKEFLINCNSGLLLVNDSDHTPSKGEKFNSNLI
jgi:methionyl-tRNA formyltransferase